MTTSRLCTTLHRCPSAGGSVSAPLLFVVIFNLLAHGDVTLNQYPRKLMPLHIHLDAVPELLVTATAAATERATPVSQISLPNVSSFISTSNKLPEIPGALVIELRVLAALKHTYF